MYNIWAEKEKKWGEELYKMASDPNYISEDTKRKVKEEEEKSKNKKPLKSYMHIGAALNM